MGSGGGSSGGGGSVGGKQDYPKYMKKIHRHILWAEGASPGDGLSDGFQDIDAGHGILRDLYEIHTTYGAFVTAKGITDKTDPTVNPYYRAVPYDPSTQLTDSQEKFEEFYDLIRELSYVSNWQDFIDKADAKLSTTTNLNWTTILTTVKAQADSVTLSSEAIDDAIDAFDTRQSQRMNREISELRQSAADMGSVMSSSFIVGESLIRAQAQQRTSEFTSDLQQTAYRERMAFIGKGVDQAIGVEVNREQMLNTTAMDMTRVMAITLGSRQSAAQLQADINRIKIVAMKEETDRELDLDVKHQLWNMQLWEMVGNIMASIAGAATVRKTESDSGTANSMLGGALSTAAAMSSMAGLIGPGSSMGGPTAGKEGGRLGGATSGAMQGAQIGALFGQPLIGAGIGGAFGAFK